MYTYTHIYTHAHVHTQLRQLAGDWKEAQRLIEHALIQADLRGREGMRIKPVSPMGWLRLVGSLKL